MLRDCVVEARARRHQNTVVCGADGPLGAELRRLGVEVVEVPRAGKLSFALNVPALTRLFILIAPDVVLLYGPVAGCYGAIAAAAARTPAVYEAHFPSFFADRGRLKRVRNTLVELISCRLSRAVTVLTESDRQEYVRRGLQRSERIFVVSTGVSLRRGDPAIVGTIRARLLGEGSFLIVAGGRMAEEKGFDVLVRAMRCVAERCSGARLCLAGEGECREALETLARRLELQRYVTFFDFQPDFELWIQAADLVVVPSRYEPAGLVAREAMVAGKPVVATMVSGSVDAIDHGRTGLLVPVEVPRALADAIIHVATDPVLARRLGEEARAVARDRFTLDRMWDEYERVLERSGLTAQSSVNTTK